MKTSTLNRPWIWVNQIIQFILNHNESYYSFVLIAMLLSINANAQYCNSGVPTFTVDLSSNPNTQWISPVVQRNDYCCGTSNPDKCVEFVITLNPQAQGIVFDIYSGSMPPGSMFYQVDCGPVSAVGQPICLSGAGPHHITFCKPGNNTNEYIIRSIPEPSASNNLVLNDGCSGTMQAFGLDETSIVWNSIFPGNSGDYNNLLSCSTGCDSVSVTGGSNFPSYIDYQVCGIPAGGCSSISFCDTIRIEFNPTLSAVINPLQPTVCFGSAGTTIAAIVQGGAQPYTYNWSNGISTSNNFVVGGTYSVAVSDASNCPSVVASVTVTEFANPITANAGANQTICRESSYYADLSGQLTAVFTGVWTGGNGFFFPNNTTLNAIYVPDASEWNNGPVNLTLTTTNNGSCPAASDVVQVVFNDFNVSYNALVNNVTCNGLNNGNIIINPSVNSPAFTTLWSNQPNLPSNQIYQLSPGNYVATLTAQNGCFVTDTFAITQPTSLTINSTIVGAKCNGDCNGEATVFVNGGRSPYTYQWFPFGGNATNAFNLCAGNYMVVVKDNNNCNAFHQFEISEPSVVSVQAMSDITICANQTATLTTNASGGNGNYTTTWQPGNLQGNSVSVNPLQTTTYTALVNDVKGCTAALQSMVVHVQNFNMEHLTASGSQTICLGDSAKLSVSVKNYPYPVTYAWSYGLGNGSGPYTVSPESTTAYTVNVSNNCGITLPLTIPVNVVQAPKAILSSSSINNCGETNLTADLILEPQPQKADYFWKLNNGVTSRFQNPTFSFTKDGNYVAYIKVTHDNGCIATYSTNYVVDIDDIPTAVIEPSATVVSITKPDVYFGNASQNSVAYQWYIDEEYTSNEINMAKTFPDKGKYNVVLVAISEKGCKNSSSVEIEVEPEFKIFIPNTFTPNNDTKNDIFTAQGIEIHEFELLIVNRWGDIVYRTNDIDKGWDGTIYEGTEAKQDVYIYKINVRDHKNKAHAFFGDVTLLR